MDHLDSIDPKTAKRLASKFESLRLNGITSLDETCARILASIPRILCLDGLAFITVEIANILSKHEGLLSLGGIKRPEDLRGAGFLAEHDSTLFLDGLEEVPDALSLILSRHKRRLSLNGVKSLSFDAAMHFANTSRVAELSLKGLQEINPIAARALSKSPRVVISDYAILQSNNLGEVVGSQLTWIIHPKQDFNEPSITAIDEAAAKQISEIQGNICLSGLRSISDEVASHLSKSPGSLNLSGLKKLSDKAALTLLDRTKRCQNVPWLRSKIIDLSGLETISGDLAIILSHAKKITVGEAVRDSAKASVDLSKETAEILTSIASGWLNLNDLMHLCEGASEALANFDGTIELNRISAISIDDAYAFAVHGGRLSLSGLVYCEPEAARALMLHRDLVTSADLLALSSDLRTLPDRLAHMISRMESLREGDKPIDLCWVSHLNSSSANLLIECRKLIALDGLKDIGGDLAAILGRCPSGVSLNGLRSLTLETAQQLAICRGPLILNGLLELQLPVAWVLARHTGILSLAGLPSISTELGMALAAHDGDLNLDGIEHLCDSASLCFTMHRGFLSLNGLSSLTPFAAKALSSHKGAISLRGIKEFEVNVLECLLHNNNNVDLSGLSELCDEASVILGSHRGRLILDGVVKINEKAAASLARHDGYISLNSLLLTTGDFPALEGRNPADTHVIIDGRPLMEICLLRQRIRRAESESIYWEYIAEPPKEFERGGFDFLMDENRDKEMDYEIDYEADNDD